MNTTCMTLPIDLWKGTHHTKYFKTLAIKNIALAGHLEPRLLLINKGKLFKNVTYFALHFIKCLLWQLNSVAKKVLLLQYLFIAILCVKISIVTRSERDRNEMEKFYELQILSSFAPSNFFLSPTNSEQIWKLKRTLFQYIQRRLRF